VKRERDIFYVFMPDLTVLPEVSLPSTAIDATETGKDEIGNLKFKGRTPEWEIIRLKVANLYTKLAGLFTCTFELAASSARGGAAARQSLNAFFYLLLLHATSLITTGSISPVNIFLEKRVVCVNHGISHLNVPARSHLAVVKRQ
jgi:hypothetical protein